MNDNRTFFLLKLLQLPQIGAQKIARLLSEVNFDEFCHYDKNQLRQIGWNEKQIQRWFNPDPKWIDPVLAWAEQEGNTMLTLFDDNYPFLLRQISTAPPILFVKGSVASLTLPQIAIVGSRDYSPYGEHWAGYFAAELVKHQFAVTSGLAIGIDGFCHQRAVAEKGITIAVLGSGLDRIYPTRHKRLSERIIETGGALVSEFFPQQPPIAEHFPRRNRIISGLSLGTLVIEATINSGSLITARYALEQGREVFALPNSVQNPYAQGCHKLIKEGAILTESIDDILQAVQYQIQQESDYSSGEQGSLFAIPMPMTMPMPMQEKVREIQGATATQAVKNSPPFVKTTANATAKTTAQAIAKNLPEMTACQQKITEHISLEPISIDDLGKATDLSISDLLVELLHLELIGVVKSVSGGYVRA